MEPTADLQHRLPELSLDELRAEEAVQKVLAYAEASGITKEQLRQALSPVAAVAQARDEDNIQTDLSLQTKPAKKSGLSAHLSTTSVLFYIGGILLFAGIMIGIYQEGDAKSSTGVDFSLGLMGGLFWVLAYILLNQNNSEEDTFKSGLGDSASLLGSLFLFACAGQSLYLIADNVAHTRTFLAIATLWLATLAALHYALDRKLKRLLLISLAALSAIATFYSLLWTLLLDAQNVTIYILMVVLTGIYVFVIGTVFKNGQESRRDLARSFHSLGGLVVMGSLYSLILTGSHEIIWTLLYPSVLYGAFLYSIRSQSKTFLATGSLFLIIYVTTIVTKYFAGGLGPAVALIIAAIAITGSAIFSLYLRNKYFRLNEK